MAKILVVDDIAINRKLLIALLSHDGHVTLEASDGAEALAVAAAEAPQLVISDILMPSMDGYSFVRQLRADARLRATPVIFYTAHFHEHEARELASACGVACVLVKPCPTGQLLNVIDRILTGIPESDVFATNNEFDREHLLLITDKLAEKANALEVTIARFAEFTELALEIAAQRDPRRMLEKVCTGARNLLGARYAVIAVEPGATSGSGIFATCGVDLTGGGPLEPDPHAAPLVSVIALRRPWRAFSADRSAIDAGLPTGYPPASAFLAVPLATPVRAYGWVCLADKIGANGFDAEDEKVLGALAAIAGRIYGEACRDAQRIE